jgi:hypothetical protein
MGADPGMYFQSLTSAASLVLNFVPRFLLRRIPATNSPYKSRRPDESHESQGRFPRHEVPWPHSRGFVGQLSVIGIHSDLVNTVWPGRTPQSFGLFICSPEGLSVRASGRARTLNRASIGCMLSLGRAREPGKHRLGGSGNAGSSSCCFVDARWRRLSARRRYRR